MKDKFFNLVVKMQNEPRYVPNKFDNLSAKKHGYADYEDALRRCNGVQFNKILEDAEKMKSNN